MWKVFFALFLWGLAAPAPGEERGSWRVWLEPRFMHAPVSEPVPRAQRTDFAAGTLADEGLTALPKGGLEKLGVPWADFRKQAEGNAAADVTTLKVEYTRNRKQVIEYAEVSSPSGLIASAVLTPQFLEKFQDTLGPTFLLAVPNRYRAYAFPKLASRYEDYAGLVLAAYRATAYPVSLEVFEVSAEGLRAVGIYADPRE